MDSQRTNIKDDKSVDSTISPIDNDTILQSSPTALQATFQLSPDNGNRATTPDLRNVSGDIFLNQTPNRELGELYPTNNNNNLNTYNLTSSNIISTHGRRMSLDRDTSSNTPDMTLISNSNNINLQSDTRRMPLDRGTSSITPGYTTNLNYNLQSRTKKDIPGSGANNRPTLDIYGDGVGAVEAGIQDSEAANANFITNNLLSGPRRRDDFVSVSGVITVRGDRVDLDAEDGMSDD